MKNDTLFLFTTVVCVLHCTVAAGLAQIEIFQNCTNFEEMDLFAYISKYNS